MATPLVPRGGILERFHNHLRYERNMSPHTVEAYLNDVIKCAELHQIEYRIDAELSRWLHSVSRKEARRTLMMMVESGDAPSSIRRRMSSMRALYTFLNKSGVLTDNPWRYVQPPRTPNKLPPFVNAGTLTQHIEALYELTSLPGSTKEVDAFKLYENAFIVDLLFQTGLRRSEAASLTLESFDYATCSIKVMGKRRKERIIPFGTALLDKIKIYLQYRNLFALDTPNFLVTTKGVAANHDYIYRVVRRALESLAQYSHKSPHVLRHSFASALLNNGAELLNVKEVLGHESVAATSVYTHTTFEELKRMYNAHPRAQQKSDEEK